MRRAIDKNTQIGYTVYHPLPAKNPEERQAAPGKRQRTGEEENHSGNVAEILNDVV